MIPNIKQNDYPTEERIVGTLSDGTKIYRKKIETTAANAINTTKTLSTIENLKHIYRHDVSWYVDNFKYFMQNPNEAPVIFIDNNNQMIESHKADYFNNATLVIILEYTKTI